MLETQKFACVRFRFYVGINIEKMNIYSADTKKKYCFKSDKLVEMSRATYSRVVSQNSVFIVSFEIRVLNKKKKNL